MLKSSISMGDDIRISYGNYDLDESEEPTLVILDTGIAVEQTPLNLQTSSSFSSSCRQKS